VCQRRASCQQQLDFLVWRFYTGQIQIHCKYIEVP